jgi:hypothetical protein
MKTQQCILFLVVAFLWLPAGLNAQDITTTSPLPNAYVGEEYEGGTFQFQANPPAFNSWSWEKVPAAPGPDINNTDLVLNPDGTVTGMPSDADDNPVAYSIRVTVTDGSTDYSEDFQLLILERRTADYVLVLDRSGSMGWTTDITPPAADRWDALKNAVNNFMNKLADPTIRIDGDRVGLTYFHTAVLQPDATRFPTALIALDAAAPATVSTELGSQTPSGWTATGAGLQDGLGKLSSPANVQNILLFTDGEQNQDPMVDIGGQQIGGANILSAYPATAGTKKIFSVGIGSPAGLDHTTLLNLADEHRGSFLITSNGNSFNSSDVAKTLIGNIDAVFNQAFIDMLHEYSPQCINFSSGSINPGNNVVTLAQFPINANVKGLMIELIFDRKHEIPSLIQLLSRFAVLKDGVNVMQFAQPRWVGNYTNSVILSFNFEVSGQPSQGDWMVQFAENPNIIKGAYTLSAIVNDHRLDYEAACNPRTPSVGDELDFRVGVRYQNAAIDNATIQALVFKPGDDIGDLLARHELIVDVDGSDDAGSAGIQKYQALLESDPDFVAQLLPQEQAVTLAHQGDGVYTGAFNQVDVAGIYQILYIIRAAVAGAGDVLRIHTESKYVSFGDVDLAQSAPTYLYDAQANVTTITIRPMTSYGKFVGPAMANAFQWDADGSQIIDVQDNQDGSYSIRVQGNANQVGALTLLGKPVFEGRISDLKCYGPGANILQRIQCWLLSMGLPAWLVWVILALLLLIIILIIRSRRNNP